MIKEESKTKTWIAVAALLSIYLCFLTKDYFFDGIAFAQAIEDAPKLDTSLIHPNHLLYNVIGYLFYKSLQTFGLHLRAIEALQVMNCLLSVASAYVLYMILRLSLRSLYLCRVLALLFAFSATWWKFSVDADAYVPSVLFILASFYLIHPSLKPRPLLVALAFTASMCFHQLAVFFYPVAALGLYLQTPGLSRRERILMILRFSAAAFLLTCGAYFFCFYLSTGALSLKLFARWLTSFSPDASFTFNAWGNLVHTLRGHVRLFFGGRFNLIKGLLNPFIVALMLMLAAAVSILCWSLIRTLPGLKLKLQRQPNRDAHITTRDAHVKPLVRLCLLWTFIYIAFLFVWLPFHTFYRLFYLPALIVLLGVWLEPYVAAETSGPRYRAALFVAIIALSNFLFIIYPYSHAQKYPPLALALEMNRTWQPGTVIYYAATNADNALFKYVNPSTLWKQMKPDQSEVEEKELREIYSGGGTVWLEASAIDRLSSTPEGAAWLKSHTREQTLRVLNDPAFNIKFVQLVPQPGPVSEVRHGANDKRRLPGV